MKLTKQEQNKIIADYERAMQDNDYLKKLSDKEVVEQYGGGISNRILSDDGEGRYLYLSHDFDITFLIVIDTNNYDNCIGFEVPDLFNN